MITFLLISQKCVYNWFVQVDPDKILVLYLVAASESSFNPDWPPLFFLMPFDILKKQYQFSCRISHIQDLTASLRYHLTCSFLHISSNLELIMKVWLDSGLIIFCQEDLIGNAIWKVAWFSIFYEVQRKVHFILKLEIFSFGSVTLDKEILSQYLFCSQQCSWGHVKVTAVCWFSTFRISV